MEFDPPEKRGPLFFLGEGEGVLDTPTPKSFEPSEVELQKIEAAFGAACPVGLAVYEILRQWDQFPQRCL